jgi:hypothetical protein
LVAIRILKCKTYQTKNLSRRVLKIIDEDLLGADNPILKRGVNGRSIDKKDIFTYLLIIQDVNIDRTTNLKRVY